MAQADQEEATIKEILSAESRVIHAPCFALWMTGRMTGGCSKASIALQKNFEEPKYFSNISDTKTVQCYGCC
jgi:hypothetical protein